jgi:hypothetical protein
MSGLSTSAALLERRAHAAEASRGTSGDAIYEARRDRAGDGTGGQYRVRAGTGT